MPLTQMLPTIRGLTRQEKFQPLQLLAEELAREEITHARVFDYEAAAQLQRLLDGQAARS